MFIVMTFSLFRLIIYGQKYQSVKTEQIFNAHFSDPRVTFYILET